MAVITLDKDATTMQEVKRHRGLLRCCKNCSYWQEEGILNTKAHGPILLGTCSNPQQTAAVASASYHCPGHSLQQPPIELPAPVDYE